MHHVALEEQGHGKIGGVGLNLKIDLLYCRQ